MVVLRRGTGAGGVAGITLEDAIVASVRARTRLDGIVADTARWQEGFDAQGLCTAGSSSSRLDQEALARIADGSEQLTR
jgi:hypothetical protein